MIFHFPLFPLAPIHGALSLFYLKKSYCFFIIVHLNNAIERSKIDTVNPGFRKFCQLEFDVIQFGFTHRFTLRSKKEWEAFKTLKL